MIPMRRLRLKRSTGWFAAGEEMAAALEMLSDAAFKLYVWLCLNVERHSGRMVWEALDLAIQLQCDRPSVEMALEELCRRQVCMRHPTADGSIARDRLSIEICDPFWPYEKMPAEEMGIGQDRYVQQVRRMLQDVACVRLNFSAADERLAASYHQCGVTLVHLQRAIWLGCARKYVALLNGSEGSAPMLITSLNYFAGLVEDVIIDSTGEDYWKHIQGKVKQLERMWIESRGRSPRNEMEETK
jgi:hypothetical protein